MDRNQEKYIIVLYQKPFEFGEVEKKKKKIIGGQLEKTLQIKVSLNDQLMY